MLSRLVLVAVLQVGAKIVEESEREKYLHKALTLYNKTNIDPQGMLHSVRARGAREGAAQQPCARGMRDRQARGAAVRPGGVRY